MKRSFVLVGCVLSAFTMKAQGIVNNGAFIVMNGAAQIYVDGNANGDYLSTANGRITPSATGIISIEGDWTNNAGNTGFTADAGEVRMVDAAQTINGSSSTTFYNLTLLGTNTKTLNVATSVGGVVITTGVLSLGTRPLDLNTRMLTVTNPAAGGITSTTGYIISETNVAANSSIVRWNIGTNTGARIIPFGTTAGVLIPLTTNVTAAMGAATDYFQVATRPTAASDNLPWSSSVTHMFDPNLAQDGSDEAVIDRWWDYTFSAAATASVTFSYRGFENTMIVPYNTGNIGAQWWAAAWLPNNANIGSAAAVTAAVGTVTAPGLVFVGGAFTPMVLSSLAAPLPVELVSFKSVCTDPSVTLTWATASEQNNDYFTVERSDDGIAFRTIGTVQGAGNSTQNLSYSLVDSEPTTSTTYYRLRQTDYNGQFTTTSPIVQEQCGNGGETIAVFGDGNDLVVSIFTPLESNYVVNVFDAQGKLVASQKIAAGIGSNRNVLSGIIPSVGVYMINVTGDSGIQYGSKVYFAK